MSFKSQLLNIGSRINAGMTTEQASALNDELIALAGTVLVQVEPPEQEPKPSLGLRRFLGRKARG